MVNEEIITALKNAIEHGDALQVAAQILVNSGYNAKEVEEASRYIGGVSLNLQPRPDENLTMATKKNILGSPISKPPQIEQPQKGPIPVMQRPIQQQRAFASQNTNIPRQNISPQVVPRQQGSPMNFQQQRPMQQLQNPIISQPSQPIYQQQQVIAAQPLPREIYPKQSHTKEIILLIILLFLVGVLISTFIFKDAILKFLSNAFGV